MNYLKVLLVVFAGAFMVSCSDAPENNDEALAVPIIPEVITLDNVPLQNFNEKVKHSSEVFSKPGEVPNNITGVDNGMTAEEIEDLQYDNLRKPIVYGVGAAGITMDTTYEESKKLLTPPLFGPFADGWAVYNEQIYVNWKDAGDRTPNLIIAAKGYLGTMLGGKFGELTFQTKFLDYKGDNPFEGAKRLTRELFVELEGVENKDYNCLSAGRCRLIYGTDTQANMVLVFPGVVLLVAKEEFQIAEIRIIKYIAPGILANNVDMLTGDILVFDQEPILLGQTHKQVFDRIKDSGIESKPEVYVRNSFIGYSWNGIWYSFHRTNYVSTVAHSEETDITKTIELSPEFPSYMTFSGLRILVKQSPEAVSFSFETDPDPETKDIDTIALSPTEAESKFKMNMRILKQNSLRFATEFSKFLKTALSVKYDVVNSRIFGYQDANKSNREIFVSIIAYNKSDLKGRSILFEVSEEQEKLSFLNISIVDPMIDGFSEYILPHTNSDVVRGEVLQYVINEITGEPILDQNSKPVTEMKKVPYFTSLVGIHLNDLVLLTELDALGRQEATVQLIPEDPLLSPSHKERVTYIEQGTYEVPVDSRPKPRDQGFVQVGTSGTTLGLQVIGSTEMGQYARVVSIGTSHIFGNVQDVCGLGNSVNFKIGMTDDEALMTLNAAIAVKKQAEPSYKCDHFMAQDTGSVGRLKEIYFPGERLKLGFSDRALTSVNVYLPLTNVDYNMPEVNQ